MVRELAKAMQETGRCLQMPDSCTVNDANMMEQGTTGERGVLVSEVINHHLEKTASHCIKQFSKKFTFSSSNH